MSKNRKEKDRVRIRDPATLRDNNLLLLHPGYTYNAPNKFGMHNRVRN
jgi:hypothetical protein